MRQVDLDELTYHLFSGLRAWTPSKRARLFAPIGKRNDVWRRIEAEALAHRMANWILLDPTGAELDAGEIEALFAAAIDALPGAIADLWASRQHDREREAQAATAFLLAQALDRFEILADTTLAPHGTRVVWFRVPAAPDHAFAPRWP